jgi:hypothetical protein
MATQANYDALTAAITAEEADNVESYGAALLGELKGGDPAPTGGEIALTDWLTTARDGTFQRLIHAINYFL